MQKYDICKLYVRDQAYYENDFLDIQESLFRDLKQQVN